MSNTRFQPTMIGYGVFKAGQNLAYVKDPQVNMELGGLANSNRDLARNETLEIALRYGSKRLARIAWLLRKITGR